MVEVFDEVGFHGAACVDVSFQKQGGEENERSARDSTSSITRSATTTETGEPMAVPCTYR